jgi:hypothetical protein
VPFLVVLPNDFLDAVSCPEDVDNSTVYIFFLIDFTPERGVIPLIRQRYPLRSRVSRLQFELNEKFKKNDVKDSEAPYELLKKKQRKNEFTGEHVSEAIDDARPENIEQLIKTAKAFIEEKEGCCYRTRNQKGIPVKDAIRRFINSNS